MSALGEILGNGAPAHTLTFEGRTYRLRPIDWGMKVELERHLYAERVKALAVTREAMDPGAYQDRLDLLTQSYENGEFSLESPAGQAYYLGEPVPAESAAWTEEEYRRAARTLPGRLYLTSLIFGCSETEVLRLLRLETARTAALLRLIISESLLRADQAGPSPNLQSPGPHHGPGSP